jgi:hypothetical protein
MSDFDECVKLAIELGRKYMLYPEVGPDKPTQEEWQLALLLYQIKLQEEK